MRSTGPIVGRSVAVMSAPILQFGSSYHGQPSRLLPVSKTPTSPPRFQLSLGARPASTGCSVCHPEITQEESTTMAKVGRFITDHAGTFCQIKLDSGEKVLVGHVGRGFNDGSIS